MPIKLFFAMETLPPREEDSRDLVRNKLEEYRLGAPYLSEDEFERLARKERLALAARGEYGDLLALCALMVFEDGGVFRSVRLTSPLADSGIGISTLRALNIFWDAVRELDPSTDLIVGYKVWREALPFLCKQTATNFEPRPPHNLCFTDKRPGFVFDVLEAWNHGADEDVSLSDLASYLSLRDPERKEFLEGREVEEAECAGRYEEIIRRCWLKVALIRSIYYRLTFQAEPPLSESQ